MPVVNPLLSSLERRDRLSAQEKLIVEEFVSRKKLFAAKSDIVRAGDKPTSSCLILSGFAARYNLLDDGRRQITAVHVAGDFLDLHSLLLAEMDHSVLALSDCEICLVPHDRLRELSATEPHFTRMLWLLTIIDAAIYRKWLVAAGRLSSIGQVAHFLCELFVRLDIVQMTKDMSFRLPMSQAELSDAMGLSIVHANRTLQQLRRQGLIEWQGDIVRILDWEGLQEVAEFDPIYLNVVSSPR